MAKILFEGKWYQELSPLGQYESTYESYIKLHTNRIWPRFHLANFKSTIESPHGDRRADFALIERDYSEWWIVEIETAGHPLKSHVIPQVQCLVEGVYTAEHARRLNENNPELNLEKLTHLVCNVVPRVLVVVNKPSAEWASELKKYGAILGVFEIFQGRHGDYLFRINGEHPTGSTSVISKCIPDKSLNRCLFVETPVAFDKANGDRVKIDSNGGMTEWEVITSEGKTYLNSPGPFPLDTKKTYELVMTGDSKYFLKEVGTKKGEK